MNIGVAKHPGVVFLEKSVYDRGFFEHILLCEQERFRMVIRSLAIPFSMLMQKGKFKENKMVAHDFAVGLAHLASLNLSGDQHLDLIKFDACEWFQKAVGDVNVETGHVPIVATSSISSISSSGIFAGFLRRRLFRCLAKARHGNVRSLCFFASYMLSKRGWPELCQQKRIETVADHQKYLTMIAPLVQDELLQEIRSTVNSVIRNTTLHTLSPSHNSCLQASRKQGGAFAWVCQFAPEAAPFQAKDLSILSRTGIEHQLSSNPSIHEVDQAVLFWKRNLFNRLEVEMQTRPFLPEERQVVRAQVLPEPGKFRLITKGDGTQYTWLQPLQGSLLSNWANTHFSTMKVGWEEEVEGWIAPEGWVWNSGDYKAATDQLNIRSTLCAFDSIHEKYRLPMGFDSGLEGVRVEYTKEDAGPLNRSIDQTNGQLMGHPLSFPLLCIINLAGLKAALKRAVHVGVLKKREVKIVLKMTKINGDDILFPCPPQMCPIWEQCAGEVGLKLSLGKSYASATFAMVNNVMFMKGASGSRRIGYLNQKLISNFCLKDGKQGESAPSPMEVGRSFTRMFEHCPGSEEFLPDMVANRGDLPLYGFQPNFFVPCELGGFGVDRKFALKKVRTTVVQRQVAALFAQGQLNSYLFMEGLPEKGLLKTILRRLPKVKMASTANVEQYVDRYLGGGMVVEDGVVALTSNAKNFQSFLASVTQFMSPAEKAVRRLKLDKLRSVIPMNESNIWQLNCQLLFPQLPHKAGRNEFRYSHPGYAYDTYKLSDQLEIFPQKVREFPQALEDPEDWRGQFNWDM